MKSVDGFPQKSTYGKLTLHQWSLAITGMALFLRLIGVSRHSYWFDEAREVLRAQTPWPDILFVSQGADPPVYRLLLYPIAQLTAAEFWLRLPSVLFGTASVYLAYRWLAMLGLPKLGVTTAVFMAVLPTQIYYAQEVSQYSFTVFLALLLLLAYERAGRYGRHRDWILLTLVNLLAIYSYYGLAFLLPVLDIELAWRTWKKRNRLRILGFIGFHLAFLAGVAALYILLLELQIARFTENKGLIPVFVESGFFASLRKLDNQLLDQFIRFFVTPFSTKLPQFVIYSFTFLTLAGFVWLGWEFVQGRRIILITLGSIAVMYVAYGLGYYPFGGRYALFVALLWAVALASVVQALSCWRRVKRFFLIGLTGFFLFFTPFVTEDVNPWVKWPWEELRPAMVYLNEHLQPDDVVYVYYGAVPAYQVYQSEEEHLTIYGTWFRSQPLEDKLSEILNTTAGAKRFWMVMSHIHANEDEELLSGLSLGEPAYEQVAKYTDLNALVVLFQRVE